MAQIGCGVAQTGCGVAQTGCGVAQIVAHRLAVRRLSSNLGSAPLEEALYRADAIRITRVDLYE